MSGPARRGGHDQPIVIHVNPELVRACEQLNQELIWAVPLLVTALAAELDKIITR